MITLFWFHDTQLKSALVIILVSDNYVNLFPDAPVTAEEDVKKPVSAVTMNLECPSPSPGLHLLHPPSPSSSDVSLPSSNSDQPTDATQDSELPSKHSQGSPSQSSNAQAKFERMTSTGPDALKKTVKDLQRSSVSLPRFQLLLEEVNNCVHTFNVAK